MSTSYIGFVTQFQFGSATDSSGPIIFKLTDIKGREYPGTMEQKAESFSSASYAIIFTSALINGYPIEVSSYNNDSTYNRVVLLSPDAAKNVLDPVSTTSSKAAAATKKLAGAVTMFQFGDAGTAGALKFQIADKKNKIHKGRMQYDFNDPSSSGFSLLFTTAMVNGYAVEAVYSDKQDKEIVCTSVRLVFPA
ncbi:hypothetical protein PHO31112_05321 [Pandoraea horticolens]|uniref:Uncharacterized protein n=1 Tax=Pandoraea horticolens TaxID=2508298 RepID=A0A5E4ZCR2_9BURK|nr:hypothetical protein [Pandoraea horticolens]VVE58457.1 hypothetical protein PHO31112_05321 [Pandoraea horticolens]